MRTRLLLFLLLISSSTFAQRFEWQDVRQQVDISADGVVTVNDERTLWTDGDFGEAFICIELEPGQSLELLNDSGALDPGPPVTAFTQPCLGGTEMVVRNAQRLTQRRVRYHYRLRGSLEPFSDVVQWYWIILEQDHPPVRGYHLTVRAPGAMTTPYDAFVHRFANPEKPTVTLSADRTTLDVTFDRIPQGDGVEIRYLMDPALFTVSGTQAGLQQLLEDEARIAGILQNKRRAQALRSNQAWGLLGLILLFWLTAGVWRDYRRYGREPDLPQMKYPFEPPSDIPPAAVTAMASQQFQASSMGPAFHATIMDLARRGYGAFSSRNRRFEMQLDLDREEKSLEPFEREVFQYLKKAAASNRRGDPAHLEFRELRRYSQKHASRFLEWWGKEAREWLELRLGGPLTSQESRRAARRWSGFSLLATAVCGLGVWLTRGPARIEFIIAGSLCLIMLFIANGALPSWRREVAAEIYGWQGFKRTLSDYTRMKDAPNDFFKLWDRYFCYAAAMGVAQRFLKNLRRAAPLAGVEEASLARQGAWLGASGVSDMRTLSQSIASLSSALSAASASASSGGSSSGGGGGGGGGSSGGR